MAQEDMDFYTQTLGLGLDSLVSFFKGHTAQFLPGMNNRARVKGPSAILYRTLRDNDKFKSW